MTSRGRPLPSLRQNQPSLPCARCGSGSQALSVKEKTDLLGGKRDRSPKQSDFRDTGSKASPPDNGDCLRLIYFKCKYNPGLHFRASCLIEMEGVERVLTNQERVRACWAGRRGAEAQGHKTMKLGSQRQVSQPSSIPKKGKPLCASHSKSWDNHGGVPPPWGSVVNCIWTVWIKCCGLWWFFLSLSILRSGHCFIFPVPGVNSDTIVNAL